MNWFSRALHRGWVSYVQGWKCLCCYRSWDGMCRYERQGIEMVAHIIGGDAAVEGDWSSCTCCCLGELSAVDVNSSNAPAHSFLFFRSFIHSLLNIANLRQEKMAKGVGKDVKSSAKGNSSNSKSKWKKCRDSYWVGQIWKSKLQMGQDGQVEMRKWEVKLP